MTIRPILFVVAFSCLAFTASAQHQLVEGKGSGPYVAPASKDAELAIKRFQVPPNLKVDLWAAEPLLANPVAFCFDEKGRAYVCETFRLGAGVDDIRGIMSWLDEELASRTVDEREAEMKRHLGARFSRYTQNSERIRLLEDRSGTGRADHATVFAEGFNTPLDGIGASVLARKGQVWYTDIPNLWLLRDTNFDGVADVRKSLHYGFGVRVGFLGHDLHGLRFGPDGKLYFSIGDRGSNVRVADGRHVGEPDSGCVFRCNPDGSELEVFCYGLRNPQDLVFDQYGNLFTGDNNSDSGDQARWVYLVEGADNGWRVGFQFMENPYSRGPFNAEKLWYPPFAGQAANIVPPIANIASGPSGVAYFPGTGLPAEYANHFFLVDFRGGAANSGVHTFTLQPKGAGFELVGREHFIWNILATDVKFGVDGGLYVSDWVQGWGMTGKGRLYRVHAPELDKDARVLETKRLLAENLDQQAPPDLTNLLNNPDLRARQEAQFALADRGLDSVPLLKNVALHSTNQLARLHAIWGLGEISAAHPAVPTAAGMDSLVTLLRDSDAEVRAQAAKVLGDRRYQAAYDPLLDALRDGSPRVRFFAALGVGKLGRSQSLPSIYAFLKENADRDPYLRHAGVMALTWIGNVDALLAAAQDNSASVRMGVLLALRRLQRPEVARFLHDEKPELVLEAARAINDEPINGGMDDLASLLGSSTLDKFLAGEPVLPEAGIHAGPEARSDKLGLEALVRRVLNANFHFGTVKTAGALATFANRADVPEPMRVEALEELGDWAHPSGRDRVLGLWRPVAVARDPQMAIQALQPTVDHILRSAPDSVRIAFAKAAGRLDMITAGPALADLVKNTNVPGKVRGEALNALAAMNSPALEATLNLARTDSSEDLRKTATRLEGRIKSSDPVIRLSSTLENGTVSEKQVALATVAAIPGASADNVISDWMDRLQAGKLPAELQLDVLEAARKRSSIQLRKKIDQFDATRPKDDPLSGYIETLHGGNASEGKEIFFEKAEAQCVRCHKVGGQGGDVGPDLTHVSSQKDRRYLLESIVLPNRQIAQGFDSVMVTLKDDDSYAGVLKSETPTELTLNTPEKGLVTIKKNQIVSRRAALSPMPEGLGQILTKEDLRNLVEYLSSLK